MMSTPQVPLIAADIAEPALGSTTVEMMAALPPGEALFYSMEANVVDPAMRSEVLVSEIERRDWFVGGTCDEYVN